MSAIGSIGGVVVPTPTPSPQEPDPNTDDDGQSVDPVDESGDGGTTGGSETGGTSGSGSGGSGSSGSGSSGSGSSGSGGSSASSPEPVAEPAPAPVAVTSGATAESVAQARLRAEATQSSGGIGAAGEATLSLFGASGDQSIASLFEPIEPLAFEPIGGEEEDGVSGGVFDEKSEQFIETLNKIREDAVAIEIRTTEPVDVLA